MTRYSFGGTAGDFLADARGNTEHGGTGTVWTARTGGTQITDLLTVAGTPITTVSAASTPEGLVEFQGPDDGTAVVWVNFGGGRVKMISSDGYLASSVAEDTYIAAVSSPTGVAATDTATLAAALTAAGARATATCPAVVRVNDGLWAVNATLTLPNRVSLELSSEATIRASVAMGTLLRTDAASFIWDQSITGGTIDANGLANIGIHLRAFANFRIHDTRVLSALVTGVKVGDSTLATSAELVMSHVRIGRATGSSMPASSRGILFENAANHSISQVVVSGYDVGVDTGAMGYNMFHDVHVWTDPAMGSPFICFRDYGDGNVWTSCFADTPFGYGWEIGSFNAKLIGCAVFMSGSYGPDNTVVGAKVWFANAGCSFIGCSFTGASGHRLLKDIDGTMTTLNVMGNTRNSYVTTGVSELTYSASTVNVAGLQVVSTRKTGYTNPFTGTVNRATTYATGSVTLVQLAERVAAIQADLTSHGLIGT